MNIEIVCSSYSKNSILWEQLVQTYKMYAPELLDKYKFTIISDKCLGHDGLLDINFHLLNKDYGWSYNLIKYLNVTKSEYIFVIFDDVFLTSKIDINEFDQILNEYCLNDMSFCRLRNSPLTLKQSFNTEFNIIDIDSPYRTVLSFAIVKKYVLLSLLKSNENAWDYEYISPARSLNIKIFETKKNIIKYLHVVEKGGYRLPCLFYNNVKSIRKNMNLFVPSPVYLFKIISGYFFSKSPYLIKRKIYSIFNKLVIYEDNSSIN